MKHRLRLRPQGCDFVAGNPYGEVVVQPFEFPLTESGFALLASAIARSDAARSAEIVRVGVEPAGHYHRTLVARLRSGGYEVVELNPAAVKESRAQQLLARLNSDPRLEAMAELMVRGAGRQPTLRTNPLATQAAWAAHRRRKVDARVALANQVIGELDLVLPGLDDCFKDLLRAQAGRIVVSDISDLDRVPGKGSGVKHYVGLGIWRASGECRPARRRGRGPLAARPVPTRHPLGCGLGGFRRRLPTSRPSGAVVRPRSVQPIYSGSTPASAPTW